MFAGDEDERRGYSSHSYIDYLDFREGSTDVLTGLAAFYTEPGSLTAGGTTERINVGLVSDNYFSVFAIHPLVGRTFLPDENIAPRAHYVAVVAESLWRRQLGAATDLSGKVVSINNTAYAVVGVVPERAAQMFGFAKIDAFVPAMMQGPIRGGADFLNTRGNHEFLVVGRLRAGVTLAQAKTVLRSLAVACTPPSRRCGGWQTVNPGR